MPPPVIQFGGGRIGVADVSLHVFEAGPVVQSGGNESRPHGVGVVAIVQAQERRVLAKDPIDRLRMAVPTGVDLMLVFSDRAKERAGQVVAMTGELLAQLPQFAN